MWNQIKQFLANRVFRKEYKRIEIERKAFIQAREAQEKNEKKYREFMQSRTITDLVREQLHGFDFQKQRNGFLEDIPADQLPSFLEEAVTIMKGRVFPHVEEYVRTNQIDETINDAETIEHVNFGRATLNGIALIREAMESLVTEYDERHKTQEPFDKHSAT